MSHRYVLLYSLPAVAFTVVFFVFPMLFAGYVSFYEWNGLGAMTFVGWDNFNHLLHDPVFKKSLRNTLMWILSAIFLHVPVGLLLALVLAQRPKGWKFFRTLFFLPNVISTTALAFLWYFVLHVKLGILNNLFKAVGLGDLTRAWLSDPDTALFANQLPFILYVGFTMVVFLTQITSISPDLYEAADLDGATGLQKDYYITMPLLKRTFAMNILFNVAFCLRMFEYPFLMTGGGPVNSTMNMSLYMYKEMVTANRYGVSMAAGLLTILFGLIIMGAVFGLIRLRERREAA
ncbi:sugar ABC transporter permease [Paenibacillus xerothermodurans]|uniref:Sugar ABC transporter permease n=1 Tax=Paenibacillus xerothermodurans TaxID=1977292 RepID=A0A2W1NDX8_PAEXE|nr:sugar ABC transporter permease [Paenibacillus xerothermodurans]